MSRSHARISSRSHRSGEHLIRLINDLLDLSRADIDELNLFPEIIDTRAFLSEVFGSVADHSPAQSSVAWRLSLPERLPLLQADPVRVKQIVLNLLGNALKFTTAGQIILGAEVLPPYMHLWVADTGIGIPIDLQERIFEPFVTEEQTGRRPSGIGLDLSITRQLVALHHGWMSLESQPGRGSTFHVYLPLPNMQGQAPAARQAARPALLLISAHEQPVPALVELCHRQGLAIHRLQPGDDPRAALQAVQPVALAWDLANACPGDWPIIERLRSYPECCQIPFMLYGEAQGGTPGMTNVLTKPLSGKSLLEIVQAMQPDVSGPILIVDDDPETMCAVSKAALTRAARLQRAGRRWRRGGTGAAGADDSQPGHPRPDDAGDRRVYRAGANPRAPPKPACAGAGDQRAPALVRGYQAAQLCACDASQQGDPVRR